MDKKSKILLSIFLVLIIVSITLTYYKYIILRDFNVINTQDETVSTSTSQ